MYQIRILVRPTSIIYKYLFSFYISCFAIHRLQMPNAPYNLRILFHIYAFLTHNYIQSLKNKSFLFIV